MVGMQTTDRKKVVAEIKELAKHDDFESVTDKLEERVAEYRRLFEEDKRLKLEAFIADGDKPEDFVMPKTDDDLLFEHLLLAVKDKRKRYLEQKRKQENDNAEIKTQLLREFDALLQDDEHIGKAFEAFNSIRDRWKKIGSVPPGMYKDLQHKYHEHCDRFFYDIKIYKELQQNDLKKNLELKRDLLDRMTRLLNEPSIRETEVLLKAYQIEWDEIGPTFQDEWQKVREEYYHLVRQLSDKIGNHFKTIRDRQKENLQAKRELVDELKKVSASSPQNPADWKAATDKVDELQNRWKQIGFALKGKSDEVWKEFREGVNAFYETRKQFFAAHREKFASAENHKKEIIDKVKQLLQQSEDAAFNWKEGTEAVKKLQDDWKRTGNLMRGAEQKVYQKFRGQCDAFFEKKSLFFKSLDAAKDQAASEIKAFMTEVSASNLLKNAESAREEAERLADLWHQKSEEWGKQAEQAGERLFAVMEEGMVKAGLAADEAAQTLMEIRLKQAGQSEDILAALSRESKNIHLRLDKLKAERQEAENALALFSGNPKHPVFIETGKRIAQTDKRIESLQQRLSLLREMRKKAQSNTSAS